MHKVSSGCLFSRSPMVFDFVLQGANPANLSRIAAHRSQLCYALLGDVCESNPGLSCKRGGGADGLYLLSLSKAANDYRWMHCCIILAGLFSQFFHKAAKPSLHALLDPETSLLKGSLFLRSVVLRLVKSV